MGTFKDVSLDAFKIRMKGYVISFRNVHSRLVHNISVEWLSTYADGGLTDADMEAISEPLNQASH